VADTETIPAADDRYGWIYQPSTLNFQADAPGRMKMEGVFSVLMSYETIVHSILC
jgi:hypothetical protein